MPTSSPFPCLSLSQSRKQIPTSLEGVRVGFRSLSSRSSSSLQDLGRTAPSLHMVVQEDKRVTLGHGGSREAQSQDSDFSICPSEKQKSATQNPGSRFSPKRPSRVRAGEAGPRAAPPPPPLSPLSDPFQTLWCSLQSLPLTPDPSSSSRTLSHTPDLRVDPLLLQPALI